TTGEGIIDLAAAYKKVAGGLKRNDQNHALTGTGSIDNARGSFWYVDPATNLGRWVPNNLVGAGGTLTGDVDWLGNKINVDPKKGATLAAKEKVDESKSPYCLPQSDWTTQAGYKAGGACVNTPGTANMPTAWTNSTKVTNGVVENTESWNGNVVSG